MPARGWGRTDKVEAPNDGGCRYLTVGDGRDEQSRLAGSSPRDGASELPEYQSGGLSDDANSYGQRF